MRGSVALAAYSLAARPLQAAGLGPGEEETLIPFLDVQPAGKMLLWKNLTTWVTPNESLYEVTHYPKPNIPAGSVNPRDWKVEFTGQVKTPRVLTLADIQARPKRSVTATLECGGNGVSVTFMGAIGNIVWTGTPLRPLLDELGLTRRSEEVVFYGQDEKVEHVRDGDYPQHFARSLAIEHARRPEVMLVWEMNGQPLEPQHGYPLRLIVPGWHGIAWVKWLRRIDILDRRFMGRWMAREYVTLRGEERPGGEMNWRETSVCNLNVKSIVARAVRRPDQSIRFTGAAWSDGTPVEKVEVRIDDGPWRPARLERKPKDAPFTWTFWHLDWPNPPAGDHTVVSRAIDADGRVQPAGDDPAIKDKKTYWEANQQWPRRLRLT